MFFVSLSFVSLEVFVIMSGFGGGLSGGGLGGGAVGRIGREVAMLAGRFALEAEAADIER